MPNDVLGIPTFYILVLGVLWMVWASFFGKHNRYLARLAVVSLLVSLGAAFHILNNGGIPNDYPTLRWVVLGGLMTFWVASVAWFFFDFIPTYRKRFRSPMS